MKQIAGKLIGTSNENMAKRIGSTVTMAQITHGNQSARVSTEHHGKTVIIIISYKEDIYELQKTTQFTQFA